MQLSDDRLFVLGQKSQILVLIMICSHDISFQGTFSNARIGSFSSGPLTPLTVGVSILINLRSL